MNYNVHHLLVTLGTRLEEFDQHGKAMAYDLGK